VTERPLSDQPSSPSPDRSDSRPRVSPAGVQRTIVLAYIVAIAMPPAGLLLAIVVARLTAGTGSRHALWIVAVSLVASLAWILIISGGALNTTNTDY